MKMIGMSLRSAAIRFCSSRPLRSGSATSSTRQLGTGTRGCARNSRADANDNGCQPAVRISGSSDSRTETSSSTMNTIGVDGIGDLGHLKVFVPNVALEAHRNEIRSVTIVSHWSPVDGAVPPHPGDAGERREDLARGRCLHCDRASRPTHTYSVLWRSSILLWYRSARGGHPGNLRYHRPMVAPGVRS